MEYEFKPLQPGNFRCDTGRLTLTGGEAVEFQTAGVSNNSVRGMKMIAVWRANPFPDYEGVYGSLNILPEHVTTVSVNGIDGPVPSEFRDLLDYWGIDFDVQNQRPALQPLPTQAEKKRPKLGLPADVIVKGKRR
jgi:hypothetical protein